MGFNNYEFQTTPRNTSTITVGGTTKSSNTSNSTSKKSNASNTKTTQSNNYWINKTPTEKVQNTPVSLDEAKVILSNVCGVTDTSVLNNFRTTVYGGVTLYNLHDIIAYAKGKGVTNTAIANGLSKVYTDNKFAGCSYWTADDIKTINANHNSTMTGIADYVNKNNPSANAYVRARIMKKNGEYTTIYSLCWTDSTGRPMEEEFEGVDYFLYKDGTVNRGKFNVWFDEQQGIHAAASSTGNSSGSYTGNYGGNTVVKEKLPTDITLSDKEVDSLKVKTPDVTKYAGLNIGDKSNVSKNLFNSFKNDSSGGSIERTSLAEMLSNADAFNQTFLDSTKEDINIQQAKLLQQIQNDPALYEAVVSQLRADANKNITAGQRVANIGAQAESANQTYDEQAQKLLSNLLGENNVADNTRSTLYSTKVDNLDAYIQGQLGKAVAYLPPRNGSVL